MSEGLLVNVLSGRVGPATPLQFLWERIHSRLAIPSSNTLWGCEVGLVTKWDRLIYPDKHP